MAEACSSTISVVDLRCRVECPVCFDVFRNPKSLNCGHSLCQECSQQLTEDERVFEVPVIVCPVCRTRNVVPGDGLPTNFSLADLVNQVVSEESKKLFGCASCDKKNTASDSWLCHSCGKSSFYCSTCSLKAHRGHILQQLDDLLINRRKELDLWKEKVTKDQRGLQMRNQDVTTEAGRLGGRLRSLAKLLEKGTEEWVKNRSREIIFKVSRDINKIYTDFKEIDAKLVSKNMVEIQLQNEKEMQAITEKQRKNLDELSMDFKSVVDPDINSVFDSGMKLKAACRLTSGEDSGYYSPRKMARLSRETEEPCCSASITGRYSLTPSPNYSIATPGAVISDSDNNSLD